MPAFIASESNDSARSLFELVTAGHHFLLRVVPFSDPESRQALTTFVAILEAGQWRSTDLDAVLLRCLVVLSEYSERVPSLVDRYLSMAHSVKSAPGRFATCVEDILRFRAVGDGTVQEILDFVSRHYGEAGCTPGAIASEMNLTISALCVLFKRHTGRTLREHIRHVRVSEAAVLLSMTGNTVKEVWARVGYNHTSNFDHDFKRQFGVAPSEYRTRTLRAAAREVYDGGPRSRSYTRALSPLPRHVLIVDDDESSRNLIATFLQGTGDVVSTAASGAEGLQAAEIVSPDVIVLDYHLGDMNGHEFLLLLRARTGEGPPRVVLFTADWNVVEKAAAIRELNAFIVQKLCDLKRLKDTISYVSAADGEPNVGLASLAFP